MGNKTGITLEEALKMLEAANSIIQSQQKEITDQQIKIDAQKVLIQKKEEELSKNQINFVYAEEADVLNMSLFGMTAKEWRDKNPNKEYMKSIELAAVQERFADIVYDRALKNVNFL
mgnify:CR=1 FL=1